MLDPFSLTINVTQNEEIKTPPSFYIVNHCFYDSFQKRVERILIFTTDFQLNITALSKHIYFDGTFRVAPTGFVQLFTIHAYNDINKSIIPTVFFLLTRKFGTIYTEAFNQFKSLFQRRELVPVFQQVQSDFEIASQTAF